MGFVSNIFVRRIGSVATLFLAVGAANAGDVSDRLTTECAVCHNLTGPAALTLAQLAQRKGPDLFYAGNKYKSEWIETWLQNPQRIRPSGMYYPAHVKKGEKGDEVDASTLIDHPKLNAAEAKAVAAKLSQLKPRSELVKAGDYQPGAIAVTMGEMLFDKFRGCMACHEIEPGFGGVSGPEVYTAARRLQEDYMVSFIRNPQLWEPKTFMPNKHLTETDIQKVVHYLRALSEVK